MTVTRPLCRRCRKPLTKERITKRKTKCYLCEVAAKREQRLARHDWRVTMNGFTGEDYWKLYEAQDGHCAILSCRANGKIKFLSVDHDHKCDRGHPPAEWCRCCVRGLVCTRHNTWLGYSGDNPEVFDSLASYLRNPPARRVL